MEIKKVIEKIEEIQKTTSGDAWDLLDFVMEEIQNVK